ncbi:cytochrome C [Nitrospina watsonii]|uniref:Ubiquinol-cytochrome c reductase, cytochrome b subunit petD n=1 Tax=Nitrospina watsonii TaxID=1323948 RepID=A0ABM9HDT1_9BACT|nr:cytochrome C [Nitrospina watsonii]CAI2718405.1 putative ubiquinol-cytochrome c reductase, cytochrome b subunit petD [Nitrospina watsonii]
MGTAEKPPAKPPAKPAAGAPGKAAPKKKVEELPEKVHVWPYLVRLEFLCSIIVILALTVWSILIDAPLEEAANPTKTPNPSKAPWYFLGLQDILVYFDPWFAGVVAPVLIIVGLMLIPYLDMNPKGNGYYTYAERKLAIWVYAFGFLVLWIALIIMGVFLRGPGWNLFMPWQYWDPHKVVALTNVDLPYALGVRTYDMAMLVGAVVVLGYFAVGTAVYFFLERKALKTVGFLRMFLKVQLYLIMVGIVVKIVLRLGFNIKYIWVTPWFNV